MIQWKVGDYVVPSKYKGGSYPNDKWNLGIILTVTGTKYPYSVKYLTGINKNGSCAYLKKELKKPKKENLIAYLL